MSDFNFGGAASGAMMGAKVGSVVPGIGTAIGAVGGGLLGGFGGSLFGGGDEGPQLPPMPDIPDYYLSDYYSGSQEELMPYAKNIMQGVLPDYFSPIGEYGGDYFDQLLSDVTSGITRNVSRSVDEDIARRGVGRGGLGTTAKAMGVANRVGEVEGALRLDDYNRALNARGDLLGIGINTMSNVGASGLAESGMQNEFNLNQYDRMFEQWQTMVGIGAQAGQVQGQQDDMFGDIVGMGMDFLQSPAGQQAISSLF